MLDMGFLPDITRVMTHSSMPKKGDRRTLMFSATFPDQVQHMAIGKFILIILCSLLMECFFFFRFLGTVFVPYNWNCRRSKL